jgi:ribosome-associated protein
MPEFSFLFKKQYFKSIKVLSLANFLKPFMTKNKASESLQFVDNVVEGIKDKKGSNITILDLSEIENSISNFFIICEGDSNVHVDAIADSVEDYVRKHTKEKPFHIEGKQNAQWILLDYLDVVVHVFQRATRDFYSLEALWSDAKKTVVNIQ